MIPLIWNNYNMKMHRIKNLEYGWAGDGMGIGNGELKVKMHRDPNWNDGNVLFMGVGIVAKHHGCN